jgi:hypothetical protein
LCTSAMVPDAAAMASRTLPARYQIWCRQSLQQQIINARGPDAPPVRRWLAPRQSANCACRSPSHST